MSDDSTRTGFERLLGPTGTGYANELLRAGAAVLAERQRPPTADGESVCTVAILRRRKVAEGNPAVGKDATWANVAGLDAVQAVPFTPSSWSGSRPGAPAAFGQLKEGERAFLLVDVPADGKLAGDRVLLTDRIRYDDPVYGPHAFQVIDVAGDFGAGLIWVKTRYSRED
jgi:hypothetical protein